MKKKIGFLTLVFMGILATSCSIPAIGGNSDNVNSESVAVSTSEEKEESSSQKEEVAVSEGLTYVINADGLTYSVTGVGDCKDSKIVIPSVYQGKAVTKIAEEAFAYTEGITEVFIPSSVEKIQPKAFFYCADLEKVTFEVVSGWEALASDSLITGDKLDVTNSSQAVILLTTTYVDFYWVQTNK